MSIPNFGDLVESKALDGDKVKLDDVLNKPIVVIGFRIGKSKFTHKGTESCTTIQFYYEDDSDQKHYVLFTGSSVICDQITEIKEKLDAENMDHIFRTTVKKVGNYHCLT